MRDRSPDPLPLSVGGRGVTERTGTGILDLKPELFPPRMRVMLALDATVREVDISSDAEKRSRRKKKKRVVKKGEGEIEE
jgi:hypothetical protein